MSSCNIKHNESLHKCTKFRCIDGMGKEEAYRKWVSAWCELQDVIFVLQVRLNNHFETAFRVWRTKCALECRETHVLDFTSINTKQTSKGLMQDSMLANSKPRWAINQDSRQVIPSKVGQSWVSIKSMNKLTYHEVLEHKLSNPTKSRSWSVILAARKLQHACNPAITYGKISIHILVPQ